MNKLGKAGFRSNGFIALLCGLSAFGVQAAEFGFMAGLGLDHSDNARNTSTDEQSETEQRAEFGVHLATPEPLYKTNIDYLGAYSRFDSRTFDNETRVQGGTTFESELLPELFSWTAAHQQDYRTSNAADPETRDNTEKRQVVQTGPNLMLRVSPVDVVNLQARYIDTSFGSSERNDSERESADLFWERSISPITQVQLFGRFSNVEYDDDDRLNYDLRVVGASIAGELVAGSYGISAGQNTIDRDQGDSFSGPFLLASLTKTLGRYTVGLRANRELTDSSLGLSQSFNVGDEFDSGDGNFDAVDIVERERVQLSIARVLFNDFSSVRLLLVSNDEDYKTTLNDREVRSANLAFQYRYSERWLWRAAIGYVESEYTDLNLGTDEDKTLELTARYDITPSVSLTALTRYVDRTNDDIVGRDYDETLVGLRLQYRYGVQGASTLRMAR